MKSLPMILNDLPELSDEAAAQTADFLYELITAFENYYGSQIRRHNEQDPSEQYDLFEDDLDDSDIPF